MSIGLPHQKGSPASAAAAAQAVTWANGARARVYNYIVAHPAVSDAEVQEALGMNPNTQRPRRIELEAAGLIRPCGEHPDATGRVLYQATSKAYPRNPPKGYWRSTMRTARSHRPPKEEISTAVDELRAIYRAQGGTGWKPETVRVLQWLVEQSR